jgi:hypothetical protein
MAARDGASSVQGTYLRATRLQTSGAIQYPYPVLTTKGFISASFSPVFEDGDEINEKAADGSVCVSWKADDTFTRLDFNLSLCTPDPETAAMLAGGSVVKDATGNIVGYSSLPVQGISNVPVALEVWSIANIGGKPATDTPYWHWVFPYVKLRYEGDREFSNGLLGWEFSGQALGNASLTVSGLTSDTSGDYVTYREALINPFTYVRTASQPTTAPLFSSAYPATGADITPYVLPTGITPAGAPNGGTFIPVGATLPASFTSLQALGALGQTTAWTSGQFVRLGDMTEAYWAGAGPGWTVGRAP